MCTVSGSTVTLVAVGACTLTAHQAGGTQGGVTYAAADSSPQTVTVMAAQTIAFTPPTSVDLSAGTLDLSGSASSSVSALTAFTYSSSTSGVCTVITSTVTLVTAGACTLTAHQAGGTQSGVTYAAADSSARTVTIIGTQTITFTPPASVAFSAGTLDLSGSATSSALLTAFTYSSSTSGVCTVITSTVTLASAGACKLTAHQAGGALGGVTYAAADSSEVTVQVTVGQTITFTPPASVAFSAGTLDLSNSATSSVGLTAFTYSSSTTGVCTVITSTVTLVTAGACTLTAHQAGGTLGGATYSAAESPKVTVQVTATQTISFRPPSSVLLTSGAFSLNASSGSGLGVFTYSSSTSGVCTVSGSTVTPVIAGACKLTAHEAGGVASGVTYAAVDSSEQTVTVIGPQTITLTLPAGVALSAGTLDLSNSATSSALLTAFTYSSSTSGVCTVITSTVTLVTVGACKLTAHQAGGTLGGVTYAAADSPEVTVTVMTPQTITFNPPSAASVTVGSFSLSASSDSGLYVFTYSSSTPDVCTVSGTLVTLVAAGACKLTAHQAGGTLGGVTYAAADSSEQTVAVAAPAATATSASRPVGPVWVPTVAGGVVVVVVVVVVLDRCWYLRLRL